MSKGIKVGGSPPRFSEVLTIAEAAIPQTNRHPCSAVPGTSCFCACGYARDSAGSMMACNAGWQQVCWRTVLGAVDLEPCPWSL